MKPDTPRVLLIGRGSIGRKHEANLRSLGAEVATADPAPQARADFGSRDEALRARRYTHAVIASPPAAHLDDLAAVLKRSVCRVLVEKPLAVPGALPKAERIARTVPRGARVYMGFNWRFNSAVGRLRAAIADGSLGAVQVLQLRAREWLPKYGGNVLLESASHILDTARALVGPLSLRAAALSHWGLLGDADEAASLLLGGPRGADVFAHVNFVNKGDYEYRILVQGERAAREEVIDRMEPMHLAEMRAFLGRGVGLATLADGLANMRLLAAAARGARRSRPRMEASCSS